VLRKWKKLYNKLWDNKNELIMFISYTYGNGNISIIPMLYRKGRELCSYGFIEEEVKSTQKKRIKSSSSSARRRDRWDFIVLQEKIKTLWIVQRAIRNLILFSSFFVFSSPFHFSSLFISNPDFLKCSQSWNVWQLYLISNLNIFC
jgi:hypothetical protein